MWEFYTRGWRTAKSTLGASRSYCLQQAYLSFVSANNTRLLEPPIVYLDEPSDTTLCSWIGWCPTLSLKVGFEKPFEITLRSLTARLYFSLVSSVPMRPWVQTQSLIWHSYLLALIRLRLLQTRRPIGLTYVCAWCWFRHEWISCFQQKLLVVRLGNFTAVKSDVFLYSAWPIQTL